MNDLFQSGKLGEIMISGKWIVACYGIVLNRGRGDSACLNSLAVDKWIASR